MISLGAVIIVHSGDFRSRCGMQKGLFRHEILFAPERLFALISTIGFRRKCAAKTE